MKTIRTICLSILTLVIVHPIISQQDSSKVIDVVWLRDGSVLKGTITKWEMERGMEFKLLTGAEVVIPKLDIRRVTQDVPVAYGNEAAKATYIKVPKPYSFKEEGWYQNTSGFLHIADEGGAGIHHAMGYRFSRLLGVGLGAGIETHDFNYVRNIIPVYAEARGFFFPKKVTPYYALKIGYGFALKDEFSGDIKAEGGIHFSPELGFRFGGGDVSYYAGIEYKIQNATYTNNFFDGSGSTFTEQVSYRRLEFRTGLLF